MLADTIDLPRFAAMFNLPLSATYPPRPTASSDPEFARRRPSLPPFSSFQEHADRADEMDDNSDPTAMPSRLSSCHTCNRLQSMVHEVAIAVAELDESVQLLCNKTNSRVCVGRAIDARHCDDSPFH